jgi:hypothetical protein
MRGLGARRHRLVEHPGVQLDDWSVSRLARVVIFLLSGTGTAFSPSLRAYEPGTT